MICSYGTAWQLVTVGLKVAVLLRLAALELPPHS
jgi:hypothetical protein